MKKSYSTRALSTLKASQSALTHLAKKGDQLKAAVDLISKREGDIVITGLGKSAFIGQKMAATLTSLGHRAVFLHPVDAIHGDIGALSENDVLIALSFSGETKEVVKLAQYAITHFGVSVVAITKSKETTLGKKAEVCLEITIKEEGSPHNVAPMASTTAMLVLGDMIASALTDETFEEKHFARFHPGGALGLRLKKAKDFAVTGDSLPFVKEKTSFLDILKEINEKRLGVTGVLDSKNKLIGIITDGDIRRALMRNFNISSMLAGDIMTRTPKCILDSDSLECALSLMEKHKITQLFMVDKGNKPLGIIHIHTIIDQTA